MAIEMRSETFRHHVFASLDYPAYRDGAGQAFTRWKERICQEGWATHESPERLSFRVLPGILGSSSKISGTCSAFNAVYMAEVTFIRDVTVRDNDFILRPEW